MSHHSIFAIPGLRYDQTSKSKRGARKRKRHDNSTSSNQEDAGDETINDKNTLESQAAIEYTAVLTPAERSQRRLAGQALNIPPPVFPFPHASLSQTTTQKEKAETIVTESASISRVSQQHSLRSQHLATMTSVLHRCLHEKDFTRAGRALGLLLRSEFGGTAIDIRNEGLWGIGAEILLNQGGEHAIMASGAGLERVKDFYDRLSLQYPPSKIRPDAVNAQDFKLALFGVWIYVTTKESLVMQGTAGESPPASTMTREQTKTWELQQAEQIASQLDLLMNTVPFADDPEFLRMRGMVALWIADLIEECEVSPTPGEMSDNQLYSTAAFTEQVGPSSNQFEMPRKQTGKAQSARETAQNMFARLRSESNSPDHISDDQR